MPEKIKVVITIEDMDDGSVKVVATPNFKQMIAITKRGPIALSMAVAYGMSALTHIAAESRKLKAKSGIPRIILPPGVRGADGTNRDNN